MNSMRSLLAATLLLPLLASCSSTSPWGAARRERNARFLAGDWIAYGAGTSVNLHFNSDGAFEIWTHDRRRADVWGTFTTLRGQISFQYTGGVVPDECLAPGVYHYFLNGSHLRFRVIDDNCLARMTALALDWHRRDYLDRRDPAPEERSHNLSY